MMAVKLEAKPHKSKDDAINLLILVFIASLIGVYLIATTVLIAKDGIYYIEQAQKFTSDPISVIKGHPSGYPFLIFIAHKFVTLFSDSSSPYTWIYSAQSVTLLCKMLALVPLYFLGKFLVGSKKSFWAIFILLILPYPARFGSDVLRDWPHVLFLAVGFLFLFFGVTKGKWWMFGIVGFVSGLGYMIRPECAQLVIYGFLWLSTRSLLPKNKVSRFKLAISLFVLLVGFAIPVIPYMKARERILPEKVKELFVSPHQFQSDIIQEKDTTFLNSTYITAGTTGKIIEVSVKIIEELSDNLFYYFVPALFIGIYYRFSKKTVITDAERFFLPAFVLLNIVMVVLLYCFWQYISRRHCLPLTVFLIFYVPEGLDVLALWLRSRFSKAQLETNRHPRLFFFILLVIGLSICLPKLLRPLRLEKQGYRDAAKWLRENSKKGDTIALQDKRISFYAERKGLKYNKEIPKQAKYVVRIEENGTEEPDLGRTAKKEYSVLEDMRKKSEKKLVIYRIL